MADGEHGTADETGTGNDELRGDAIGGPDPIFGRTETVDPANIGHGGSQQNNGGGTGDGNGPRKRGRPRGSKNSTKTQSAHDLDPKGIEAILLSAHTMLAMVFKADEFLINEEEAARMTEALIRVQRHYPSLSKVSNKTVDHVNFMMCMGGIYGQRLLAIRMRKAAEKAQANRRPNGPPQAPGAGPPPADVVPFRHPPAGTTNNYGV